jgi:hypothetical protein
MMFPSPIRVMIPRFMWQTVSPDATGSLIWPTAFFDAIFRAPNGWSVRDYWSRVTFGLLDLRFDLANLWWLLEREQSSLRDDRGGMIAACRAATEENDYSLAGYDRVVCFVNPPPCNAGAIGAPGDVVLDQAGSLEMFQHEVGHLLGFEHVWGRNGVYEDPYCVMGYTGQWAHDIARPPEFAHLTTIATDFWRSGRRVAAASLYRLFVRPEFGGSGALDSGPGAAGFFDPHVAHVRTGESVWLTALSESSGAEPVLAVMPIPEGGVLAVEYRNNTGDDAGVPPAVVIQTIGARSPGAGHHEVDPPWFEATVEPQAGASALVLNGTDLAGHPFGGHRVLVEQVTTVSGVHRTLISLH